MSAPVHGTSSPREALAGRALARRRLLAVYLGRPADDDRSVPRPARALLPGLLAGAAALAGSAGWALVRPAGGPPGWSDGTRVIADTRTGARFVVLRDRDGVRRLHPVPNLASARLLLDPDRTARADGSAPQLVPVRPAALDTLPRGAPLGIPYAPDLLPDPAAAAHPSAVWAACRRADRATALLLLAHRHASGGVLDVRGPDGARWLVDARGVRHRMPRPAVRAALFGPGARALPVDAAFLALLPEGTPITASRLPAGAVLAVRTRGGTRYALALARRTVPVTPFTARLLTALHPGAGHRRVAAADLDLDPDDGGAPGVGAADWPELPPPGDGAVAPVGCVLRAPSGRLAVWSGADWPEPVDPATGVSVAPGAGLLYRVAGGGDRVWLLADTGLAHRLRGDAARRLGYADVTPVRLPESWSRLVPQGPVLDPGCARRSGIGCSLS
ncbi:type VII secretion protein EccB [Mangrovactinospora gilvigrisea]|uniref:type VII secretion protein EccB n=1 Tax=Mangrovactinospora gilvigrisea TaxID=1428644 RepID=UPI001587EA3D|nr:type VII secretion protein EccB [Mangrovactinospora gilvigrisea]